MGYRGKVEEQERARDMRARNMTLQDIATELGVAKSSVSLWVRDVPFTPSKRRTGPQRRPHPAREAKLMQIAELDLVGVRRIGMLDDDAFLAAGVALYAGEGSKTDGTVKFANTDPRDGAVLLRVAAPVLRRRRDEARVRVYLHDGLDLTAAEAHWSQVTGVPLAQFGKAYRAVADPSIRRIKHEFGCVYVSYACATTHRRVMGLVRALLSSSAIPG